jgi:hypothetical protein
MSMGPTNCQKTAITSLVAMAALVRQHLPDLDDRAEFDLRGVRSVIPAASFSGRFLFGQQRADTKRTHQKRHARRLATHRPCLGRPNLQEKMRHA